VARWDLSSVDLVDPRTGMHLATLLPLDKMKNADRARRVLGEAAGPEIGGRGPRQLDAVRGEAGESSEAGDSERGSARAPARVTGGACAARHARIRRRARRATARGKAAKRSSMRAA
jgi:hypothetical protein